MTALEKPTQSAVEAAFADAMFAAGFNPGPIQVNTADFVRFDAPGDKAGKRNGYYKLLLGDYPIGWFGDWKQGAQQEWRWDFGRELTPKERQKIQKEQRRLKAEADAKRQARQREVAEDANAIWERASTDAEGHPYLARKGIESPRGLRVHIAKDGTKLLAVPMRAFDQAGKPQLMSIQYIDPNGQKRFMAAGRVEGCWFSIKGDNNLIIICEGVATGFSIFQATGASVVMAFNAGNLLEVARDLARWRPLATLMIAGDDDVLPPDDWETKGGGKPWINAGAKKAEAAAKAVGCRWILPVFADGPARDRTDFNDLALREGEAMVAAQILGSIKTVDPENEGPGAEIIEPDFVQDESWRSKLPRTSSGNPDAANVEGVALYLENHPKLRDRLTFNDFTQSVELDGNDLADHHVAEFRRMMHADGFKAKKGDVVDEMFALARRHSHDPLADYLNGLKWDGQHRIGRWLHWFLGAEDNKYTQTIGEKFLIGAVARALSPGVKFDTALVLEGAQGVGKSTAIRYLFGDRFFVDNLPDFHSKDAFQQLQGHWCVEVAELSAMSKADVADVKQFLSRLVDTYRPPFGKMPIKVPRRCVFVGSVNPEEVGYLRDATGARRFWPVATGVHGPIRLDDILRDRDQIWAEAVVYYVMGSAFHLDTKDEIEAARAEQEERREVDPWEWALRGWIDRDNITEATIEAALSGAVAIPKERMDMRGKRRMGAALRAIGWDSRSVRGTDGRPQKIFSPVVEAPVFQFDRDKTQSPVADDPF